MGLGVQIAGRRLAVVAAIRMRRSPLLIFVRRVRPDQPRSNQLVPGVTKRLGNVRNVGPGIGGQYSSHGVIARWPMVGKQLEDRGCLGIQQYRFARQRTEACPSDVERLDPRALDQPIKH